MKRELDKAYMKKIKYITICFVILYGIYATVSNLAIVVDTVTGFFARILSMLSPLIYGIIIAYLLFPLVRFFEHQIGHIRFGKKKEVITFSPEKKKITRLISIFLATSVVISAVTFLCYSTFVMVGGTFGNFSLEELTKNLSSYFTDFSRQVESIDGMLEEYGISTTMAEQFGGITSTVTGALQGILNSIINSFAGIGQVLGNIFFGMVFAGSILFNQEYFAKIGDNLLRLSVKDKTRKSIKDIAMDINDVILGFIRGKILDLTLLSIFTSLTLIAIDFDFAILNGLFAGYTNIIPYLGTWIGIIPAVIIGLVTGGVKEAIFVGIYIVAVQQVYIVVVSPKIQGKSIGIHPFFTLLAVVILGSIKGLTGMIFAIPIAGIINVFIKRWVAYRKESLGVELNDLRTPRQIKEEEKERKKNV
ncbi:MAG: hypothetical protein K0R15_949 [Clostridiales bacterium]|jgi:predicted PurR-regulated permease PerM|nr:hypothetical protein [Clostridiales bacterium]